MGEYSFEVYVNGKLVGQLKYIAPQPILEKAVKAKYGEQAVLKYVGKSAEEMRAEFSKIVKNAQIVDLDEVK